MKARRWAYGGYSPNHDNCGPIELQFQSMCGVHAISNAFGLCVPIEKLIEFRNKFRNQINFFDVRKKIGKFAEMVLSERSNLKRYQLNEEESNHANNLVANINFLKFIINELNPKLASNILTLGSHHIIDYAVFDGNRSIRGYITKDSIYHPKFGWIPFHNIRNVVLLISYPLILETLYDIYPDTYKNFKMFKHTPLWRNFETFEQMRNKTENFLTAANGYHYVAFSKTSEPQNDCCWCYKDSNGIVVSKLRAEHVNYIIKKAAHQVLIELPENYEVSFITNEIAKRAFRIGAIITICLLVLLLLRSEKFKNIFKKKFTQKKPAKSRRKPPQKRRALQRGD